MHSTLAASFASGVSASLCVCSPNAPACPLLTHQIAQLPSLQQHGHILPPAWLVTAVVITGLQHRRSNFHKHRANAPRFPALTLVQHLSSDILAPLCLLHEQMSDNPLQ